jgi:hypothetical protein
MIERNMVGSTSNSSNVHEVVEEIFITILYRRSHQWTEKYLVIVGGFLKILD